jgi:hypothetical protein
MKTITVLVDVPDGFDDDKFNVEYFNADDYWRPLEYRIIEQEQSASGEPAAGDRYIENETGEPCSIESISGSSIYMKWDNYCYGTYSKTEVAELFTRRVLSLPDNGGCKYTITAFYWLADDGRKSGPYFGEPTKMALASAARNGAKAVYMAEIATPLPEQEANNE